MKRNSVEQEFCKNYLASVSRTGRSVLRADPPTMNFNDIIDSSPDPEQMACTVSRWDTISIEMPIDRYQAFLAREERIKDLLDPRLSINNHPADRIWDEWEEEERLRQTHPSLAIAYEKYKNLLYLVKR